MNDDTGVDYVGPWQIDETVTGFGGVGVITQSAHSDFQSGDIVCSSWNWPWVKHFNTEPVQIMLTKVC